MGLSIVIPVRGIPECTDECISLLIQNAIGDIDIIVIDNGSDIAYTHNSPFVRVLRNETNTGFWPSMLQGVEAAYYPVVLCQHNDVFVYSPAYDQLILREFERDPLLCTAGFFGGLGLGLDGGRGYPMGNMQGKKYGGPQKDHGYVVTETTPSVIFDSLAMIFRKDLLYTLNPTTIPPYHWTDRIVSLRTIVSGYHALYIPIEFDHGGSFTAVGTTALSTFAEDWCNEHGLQLDQNWDYTLYMYGLRQFQNEWERVFTKNYSQVWVGADYALYVKE